MLAEDPRRCASRRARRRSASRARTSTSRRSRKSSTSPTSSKAACASRATGCASPRSSSQVATDSHLWSETYDRELDDIFAVQDDIAQSVVKELRARCASTSSPPPRPRRSCAEVAAASKGRSENAEAYQFYLQARYHREQLTQGRHRQGHPVLPAVDQRRPELRARMGRIVARLRRPGGPELGAVHRRVRPREGRRAARHRARADARRGARRARLGAARVRLGLERRRKLVQSRARARARQRARHECGGEHAGHARQAG